MTESKPPRPDKRYAAFLRYSGLGLQLFFLMGISAWIGQKLDAHFGTPKPYITIFLILFFTTGYFYKLYKDLTR